MKESSELKKSKFYGGSSELKKSKFYGGSSELKKSKFYGGIIRVEVVEVLKRDHLS